ncbi:M15 family metallopeptidase [Streptomyces sp. NPDC058701]|uniref:M15 family metallopeptidase n=1 Tax=Streptomyces sp. NPDC058701 TaxID=3346608 RepID=UPI003660BD0E
MPSGMRATAVAIGAGLLAVLGALGALGAPTLAPGAPMPGPEPSGPPGAPAGRAAPPGFAALAHVDPTVRQDVRYATARNFTGRRVDGYREPVCLLARPAAEALRRAQRELLPRGLSLKVYDCYRPQRAVDRFVRWAGDPADQGTKAEYYPDVDKDRLIPDGYIAERSGHSRGSTVDVTLVSTASGRELDMGTAFDHFGPSSHTDAPAIPPAARANRRLLLGVLGARGFVNLPEEWWHFTHRPEAFPGTHFDFPVSVAAVLP